MVYTDMGLEVTGSSKTQTKVRFHKSTDTDKNVEENPTEDLKQEVMQDLVINEGKDPP
jgi:hypothetical protein